MTNASKLFWVTTVFLSLLFVSNAQGQDSRTKTQEEDIYAGLVPAKGAKAAKISDGELYIDRGTSGNAFSHLIPSKAKTGNSPAEKRNERLRSECRKEAALKAKTDAGVDVWFRECEYEYNERASEYSAVKLNAK